MAYSDYDRQIAIEIVRRNNGVLDAICLSNIREAISEPDLKQQTVRYWLKVKVPNQDILSDQKKIKKDNFDSPLDMTTIQEHVAKALDQKLEDAAHKFVDHATHADVIEKMSGTAAMTSAAIAIEKMRLLRDLPTEIIGILPQLVIQMKEAGIDVTDAFRIMLAKVKAQNEHRNLR